MRRGRLRRLSRRLRAGRRRRRRWALFVGLLLGLLVVLSVVILLLSLEDEQAPAADEAADEAADDSPASCERHGMARPDPRADPDPVSGLRDGAVEAGDSVQIGQEFTSGDRSSRYHLFSRGVDFNEPVGVVVRLHGDGTNEHENPDGLLNCLAAVAASHNMILLAPLSPDDQGEVTWWEDISTNLPWLRELLDERVLEPYAIDTSRVWWVGYSGGAEMISYGVLPRSPQAVTGGALMIGGGGAPQELVEEPAAEQQRGLDLIWVTGASDDGTDPEAPFDAVEAARQGSTWYRQQGFDQVSAEYPVGHDHFSLPQARILDEALSGRSREP